MFHFRFDAIQLKTMTERAYHLEENTLQVRVNCMHEMREDEISHWWEESGMTTQLMIF